MARACRSAPSRSSTSTTSSTSAATSSWSSRGFPARPSRCCATSSEREPVGQAAGRARVLGGRPRRPRRSSRATAARGTSTGSAAPPRSTSERDRRRFDDEADAGGRARLRDPRPARVVHRRSGEADGNEYLFQSFAEQNVATLNERRRDEDRRELPALLQHARERVPGLRRPLRGRPPHGAARRPGREGPPGADRRRRVDHLPRLVLPRAPQRRARRAARARRRGSAPPRDGAGPASAPSAAAPAARTCGWRSAASRSTRSARARRRRLAPRRSPSRALLHGDARRRRASRAESYASRTSRRCSPRRSSLSRPRASIRRVGSSDDALGDPFLRADSRNR